MKTKITRSLPILIFLGIAAIIYFHEDSAVSPEIAELRKKHAAFLEQKRPEKANPKLSRKDKIQQALPPNQYYELMAYLTMNPALGVPEPEKIRKIKKKLAVARSKNAAYKAPGQNNNIWKERGPVNVGGRTRVLFFDPNDHDKKRAFAAAISGGLWVNEDVTNKNSPWKQVAGLPANMNISCISIDPRDSETWYIGTGEQYTAGDVVGTGVYKTSNGGETWNKVLDVEDFATSGSGENALVVGGIHYINDIVAWDNGTSTEIFIGVSTHIYANAANPTNFLGFFDRGLYKSINGGINWEQVLEKESFNDFEIDVEGNLWVATTNSPGVGEGDHGGMIYQRKKEENTAFNYITTIPQVLRTEIEASKMNSDKFYILAEVAENGNTLMWKTTNAFKTIEPLTIPNDADTDIPPNDFARGQAFYNLMIESDPTNDEIIYAGGIDLFRSVNAGKTWQQISKWSNNNSLKDLPVSLVHADHHVMNFRPGNPNQAIFGHDGGVSFALDLAAASSTAVFVNVEKDYITTQFYSVAVAPTSFSAGDYFLGGTQDNGTQLIQNGNPSSLGILGGDGAQSAFDQVETDYFVANLIYNNLILVYDYSAEAYRFIADNSDNDGFFINPQDLDSNLDILYSNGPPGILYRYENLDELSGEEGALATRESLTNSLLTESITALAVSPYTKTQSNIVLGTETGRLLLLKKANLKPAEATWREITGPGFVGSISDVEFGSSENEVFITFYNYGVQNIWHTKNALAENPIWENREGNLPDMPVLCILPNPLNPEEVIVGTELGVWATHNFSEENPNWSQAYNGMSDVKVTDLDLRKGDNAVFAASYGRGIFSGQFTGEAEEGEEGENIPEAETILVIPTISNANFNIVSEINIEDARVEIFNIIGKLMLSKEYSFSEGVYAPLELPHLQPGIYLVKISSAEITKVQKIIVK